MNRAALFFVLTIGFIFANYPIHADNPISTPQPITPADLPKPAKIPFTAFTGKIDRNKVRMRLQPNLDGHIVRELHANDLVVVIGESEDFYAVEPPTDIKAYIYRTFVLDGVVEGARVNVRLEPDLNSPVIAQVNSGDPIAGHVFAKDKKWMEISPPSSTRFYVAKDYVQNIGDASLMATVQKQALEAKMAKAEKSAAAPLATPTPESTPAPSAPIVSAEPAAPIEIPQTVTSAPAIERPSPWTAIEQALYDGWKEKNPNGSMDDFYQAQNEHVETLHGYIEPYQRVVKNKPGDFVLLDTSSRLPIAYLYSTRANLQDKVGMEVTVQAIPRKNYNFAFPAYFVAAVN